MALDIECLGRMELTVYVPILQSSGQVVVFLTQHLGFPLPTAALFEKAGQLMLQSACRSAQQAEVLEVI